MRSLILVALLLVPGLAVAEEETDAVECSGSECKVGNITAASKAEIEKQKDFEQLRIVFRAKTTDAQLASISMLPWVTEVEVTSCKQLTSLAPLGKAKKLRVLEAMYLPKLRSVAGLPSTLEDLDLGMNDALTDISGLRSLVKLKRLNFYGSNNVASINALAGMTELERLNLYMVETPPDFSALKKLTKLVELDLWMTKIQDKDMPLLAGMTELKRLSLFQTKITTLDSLKGLTKLENLTIDRTGVTSLEPLAGLKNLKYLSMYNTRVASLAPLANLANLEDLTAYGTEIEDLAPLAGATKLRSLSISGTGVSSLAPLAKLKNLESVYLYNTAITDYSPLAASARKLYTFEINKDAKPRSYAKLKAINPKLRVTLRED